MKSVSFKNLVLFIKMWRNSEYLLVSNKIEYNSIKRMINNARQLSCSLVGIYH